MYRYMVGRVRDPWVGRDRGLWILRERGEVMKRGSERQYVRERKITQFRVTRERY